VEARTATDPLVCLSARRQLVPSQAVEHWFSVAQVRCKSRSFWVAQSCLWYLLPAWAFWPAYPLWSAAFVVLTFTSLMGDVVTGGRTSLWHGFDRCFAIGLSGYTILALLPVAPWSVIWVRAPTHPSQVSNGTCRHRVHTSPMTRAVIPGVHSPRASLVACAAHVASAKTESQYKAARSSKTAGFQREVTNAPNRYSKRGCVLQSIY
jgi:hypothetical protein